MKQIIIKGERKEICKILERLAEENKGKTVREFLDEQNKRFNREVIVLC